MNSLIPADHPLFDLLVDIELLGSTALFTELAAHEVAAYGLRLDADGYPFAKSN